MFDSHSMQNFIGQRQYNSITVGVVCEKQMSSSRVIVL